MSGMGFEVFNPVSVEYVLATADFGVLGGISLDDTCAGEKVYPE